MLGGGKDLESEEDGWKVVQNKKKRCKSSNFVTVSSCAPSGSLFNGVFLTSESDDLVPKSKSDPGPVSRCGPVVSPGSGSVSVANAQTDILTSEMQRDPAFALAVSSLERCLKVRERVGSSLILGRPGKPSGSGSRGAAACENVLKGPLSDSPGTFFVGASGSCVDRGKTKLTVPHDTADKVEDISGLLGVTESGIFTNQNASVGMQEGHTGLLEVPESGRFTNLHSIADENDGSIGLIAVPEPGCCVDLHASAGEKGIIGLQEVTESGVSKSFVESTANACGVTRLRSNSSGVSSHACVSYLDALLSAPARAPAALTAARRVAPLSAVVGLGMHGNGTSVHDACNSWSDTGRSQGPTGRRRTKGGVSSPAEELRPVSEVEAGVIFRPAGWVRGQVAGSLPGRQPGTGTRRNKGSVVTPSLHPEVPDSLSVSPGPGKRIRQSMGWTKVCETAQSGIWLLKGNARACMFPANLDHLRVGWRKQGSYKTAWVTPGQVCLCSYKYGHGAAVRPQTNKAIWDGVISLWGRVAPFLSPWCGKKELPTGVNLNHYDGSRSCVRWHSDNEPLFGPRDSPKLIVSLSLGNPVEFKVRRVSDGVTSSITLDHGDVLVMDGSAQSEYLHCTMHGLQGPRVNLTYRWVAQHTASCPLAGVVGCLLPSCVQGLAEPSSR